MLGVNLGAYAVVVAKIPLKNIGILALVFKKNELAGTNTQGIRNRIGLSAESGNGFIYDGYTQRSLPDATGLSAGNHGNRSIAWLPPSDGDRSPVGADGEVG